jgi:hypothetical protein
MKVPCNEDGSPKITIITGVTPRLNTLDVGNAINNGTLDEKNLVGGIKDLPFSFFKLKIHSSTKVGTLLLCPQLELLYNILDRINQR